MMSDLEAFLSDLRELRERRGLTIDELAALAHFPADTLAAAESGPMRPGLPVVEAYVRACGADPGPWEDRWRTLPAQFTLVSLGAGNRRRFPRPALAAAAAFVVLVAGGAAVLTLHPAAGHKHMTITMSAPPSTPATHAPATSTPAASRPVAAPRPAPVRRAAPSPAPTASSPGATATGVEVTGYGCPQGAGAGLTLDAAATGPGWTPAGGGWTGNGCDGASVWTMDPNGGTPSMLTWSFTPGSARTCTLAVFVPAQNALGVADYTISSGPALLDATTVDQSTDTGQWVTLGTYSVSASPVEIQLSPDPATLAAAGPGPGHGHGHNSAIAASAASATCH
jgi:transcriptional regulator with XRE-family HTH domain